MGEAIAQLLLDANADVHARDDMGWTALHDGAQSGSVLVVRVILSGNANIHATNSLGHSPMHYARLEQHEPIVAILTKASAKQHRRSSGTKTIILRSPSARVPTL